VSSVNWIAYSPVALSARTTAALAEVAGRLQAVRLSADAVDRAITVERMRRREAEGLVAERAPDRARALAALHILLDLVKQGWDVRATKGKVEVSRPFNPLDPEQDRLRIRQQLHAERDEQLRQPSVRAFIQSMEVTKVWGDRVVSIFSLIRDGRDLATAIRQGVQPVQPYLQFVNGENCCEHTGLRLVDIWRYFRHTWSTPYKSVPGRTMMVIVRDRSAAFHPVVGIAALSSATVGLSVRDEFIGWTTKQLIERITADPSPKYGKWIARVAEDAIGDIYSNDLLANGSLTLRDFTEPTPEVIERLLIASKDHRREHYRFMQGTDYKDNLDPATASEDVWKERAERLLFRSKREQELANLFSIRRTVNEHLGDKQTAAKVKAFIESRDGRLALAKLIRKAKADRVGTMIADLTICGAVPPYNELLGGKLVAMLMASPEVVEEYRRRYRKVPSIIASSMAGRAITRPSELVFISTTSLYGRRPNQYDRLIVPADRVVEGKTGDVRYAYLGKTRGYGTFQFGEDATTSISTVLSQSKAGQRVNYVFGEGVNPRLRMLRDGFDEVGLLSNVMLDHGAPRLVYGVSMIRNLSDYLLGIDKSPDFILPLKGALQTTEAIGRWWHERWSKVRVGREEVLDEIEKQTLVRPIQHAARVKLPSPLVEEPSLFPD
jgi:hypothetical protein